MPAKRSVSDARFSSEPFTSIPINEPALELSKNRFDELHRFSDAREGLTGFMMHSLANSCKRKSELFDIKPFLEGNN